MRKKRKFPSNLSLPAKKMHNVSASQSYSNNRNGRRETKGKQGSNDKELTLG